MIRAEASASQQFAELVAEYSSRPVPPEVSAVMIDDIIDIIGCAVWGYETAWGRRMVSYVEGLGLPGPAPVWGSNLSAPPAQAALALGTLGHAIDFDDYHPAGKIHPATIVIPAAVSLASAIGCTGQQLINAIALGFEVMIRTSLGTGSVAGMLNGYHMTGITGGVGAAAACASLMGLDAEATANAIGLGATQSAGLMGFIHEGSDTKRIHAGHAAEVGIASAGMAAVGLTAAPHMLDMPHGGFMSAHSPESAPARATADLGTRWHTAEVSFKRYSCCGSIHSSLEAVGHIVASSGLSPEDVDRITVLQSLAVLRQCGWEYQPTDATHAQMSMQYCVAVFLLDGDVLPEQFRDDRLAAPDVLDLARRVHVVEDEEMNALYPAQFASRVVVEAGGRTFEHMCPSPSGSVSNPMSAEQLESKFRKLTARRLGQQQADQVIDAARGLPDAGDLAALLEPLGVAR